MGGRSLTGGAHIILLCLTEVMIAARRAAWPSSRSAADALAQEERGPVKRLAGLVEYAGE
jgi:hypothetical protein